MNHCRRILWLGLLVAVSTQGQVALPEQSPIIVGYQKKVVVPIAGSTAAYSLNSTIADVMASNGLIEIIGKSPGATNIVAIDPLANKREMAEQMGATHAVASAAEAQELAMQLTRGVGADKSIVTVDIVNEEVVQAGFDVIRKGGTEVITGLADPMKQTVHLSGAVMTLFQKTVKGTLFGGSNPMRDITKMLDLYRAGSIKLDELVTKKYTLSEINQGYDDLLAGKNIRGVIIHDH